MDQKRHNDLIDGKETEDRRVATDGSGGGVIYSQTGRRIKYREKAVIAQIGEIKYQSTTQISSSIRPVETCSLTYLFKVNEHHLQLTRTLQCPLYALTQ